MDLRQAQTMLELTTPGRGMVLVSPQVAQWLAKEKVREGVCHVFVQHTSASLLISENASPDVQADLERFFARLAPDGDALFKHDAEGPDDMPSHIRAALTQTTVTIPVRDGKLTLGTWQSLYLYEHRLAPHQRKLVLHYLGT